MKRGRREADELFTGCSKLSIASVDCKVEDTREFAAEGENQVGVPRGAVQPPVCRRKQSLDLQ